MINLFTSYYKDKNEDRQKEIDFCLEQNINNVFIDRFYVLSETESIPYNNDKVKIINHKRPTFKDFFKVVNNVTDSEDFNILTNSDIFLDDTLSIIKNIMNKNMLF